MRRHDGGRADLPWGWWLRVKDHGLEDEDGRSWETVREAFWEGHLGFPSTHLVGEQLELLTRVLNATDRRWFDFTENRDDLFDGNMRFWRFYMCWLASVGMLQVNERTPPLEAPLSDLGRSVLAMLQATREPAWVDLPFGAVMDAIVRPGRGAADDAREQALRSFEREAARLPHVFAREMVGRRPSITLTGLGVQARMPVRRVIWSQSFGGEKARDDFFGWLAARVDRWEDWGGIAYSKGAAALTQHLLGLVVSG